MKRVFACVIIVVLLLSTASYAAQSVPNEVLNGAKSVVRIQSEYSDGYATGSGFVISSDKSTTYVATNNHVIEGSPHSISIWLDSTRKISAKIKAASEQKDLCILELAYPIDLPALILNADGYKQGDAVYAVGYPAAADGLSDEDARTSSEATITDGIVSAIRKATISEYGTSVELIQINAAINPGNSGGPLFNSDGEVIGINTYGAIDSQGIFGSVAVGELIGLMGSNGITPHSGARKTVLPKYVYFIVAAVIVLAVTTLLAKRKKKNARHMKKTVQSSSPETLLQFIDRNGPFASLEQAVSALMPIALELKDLHNTGKAYLELSPEHITISDHKAKLAPISGVEANKYSSGYTPPEIYRGKNSGAASDIYAFCAVLRYAITGISPDNALSRMEAIESGNTSETSQIDCILDKGMEVDAANRYQTMQELVYLLMPYNTESDKVFCADDDTDITERPNTKEKAIVPRHAKRKAKVGLLIPLIILVLVGGAFGFFWHKYQKSIALASEGNYSAAQECLILEPLTAIIDGDYSKYLDAGITFENQQYGSAESKFRELEDYRDSASMVLESRYRKAATYADEGKFNEAIDEYTALAEQSYKNSKDLINETLYREGVYFLTELEDYSGAQSIFEKLSEAGESKAEDMIKEAYYRQGLNYLSENQFADALRVFEKLSETGDPRADEMINETNYEWAYALADEEDWLNSLSMFSELGNYKDSYEAISLLKDIIYAEGQQAYYDAGTKGKYSTEYETAAEFFHAIHPYKDTGKYLILLNARYYNVYQLASKEVRAGGIYKYLNLASYKSTSKVVDDLCSIIDFEDAAELLFNYDEYKYVYITGLWKSSDGTRFFEMKDDKHISYNLPVIVFENSHYSFNDDTIVFTDYDVLDRLRGRTSTTKNEFQFYPISRTCMQVYCYKDGSVYTLYKQ